MTEPPVAPVVNPLPPKRGTCLAVPTQGTGRALERLGAAGLVDHRRAVTPRNDRVLVPVTAPPPAELAAALEGRVVQAALGPHPRLAPIERVRWQLEDALPPTLLEQVPQGWQVLGSVCLVRLPEPLGPHGQLVGRALAQALDVDSVVHLEGAEGELRQPRTELLWGDQDTETVHHEHGLTFHLDPRRVLFSAGNHHERHRLVETLARGETVVDLFAGIGYFTLPVARAGCRVVACEKNPDAARYLRRNVEANDLGDRVEVRQGDCRDLAPEGVADRVLLGYFPGTSAFLSTAVSALSANGGLLHYHTTAWEHDDPVDEAWQALRAEPALADETLSLRAGRVVKGYAPNVAHVVLDVEVTR